MKKLLIFFLFIASLLGAQTRPHWLDIKSNPLIDARLYGVKGDGVTDDTAALQAWLNYIGANGKTGFLPNGRYRVTTTLTLSASANIMGESCDGAIIDFTEPTGEFLIEPASDPTALPGLAAPVSPNSREIKFVSAHALAVGDTIVVNDSTDYSWSGFRAYYRSGELFEVADIVDSTTIQVVGAPTVTVPTSTCRTFKMPRITVCLENFTIRRTGNYLLVALHLKHAVDSIINNMTIHGAAHGGMELSYGYNTNITNSRFVAHAANAGNNYALFIVSSKSTNISGVYCNGARKGLDVGSNGDDAWDCLSFDTHVINSTFDSLEVFGIATHGSNSGLTVSGCTTTGLILAGQNLVITGNIIKGTLFNNAAVHTSELANTNITFANNTVIMPDASGEFISGMACFTIYSFRDMTYRGGTMRIADNNFILQGQADKFTALKGEWESMQGDEPVDVVIEGNSWVPATGSAPLEQGIDLRTFSEANYHEMPQLRSITIRNNNIQNCRQLGVHITLPAKNITVSDNILETFRGIGIAPRGTDIASATASMTINVTRNTHTHVPIIGGAEPSISTYIGNLPGAHINFSDNVFRNQRRQVVLQNLDTIMAHNNYWYGAPEGIVNRGYLFLNNNRIAGSFNLVDSENAYDVNASGTLTVYGPLAPYTP